MFSSIYFNGWWYCSFLLRYFKLCWIALLLLFCFSFCVVPCFLHPCFPSNFLFYFRVFSMRNCPDTILDYANSNENFMSFMPWSRYGYARDVSKMEVRRCLITLEKLLFVPRPGRAYLHSVSSIFSPTCFVRVIVLMGYAINLRIPLLSLCHIKCLGRMLFAMCLFLPRDFPIRVSTFLLTIMFG